LKSAMRIAMIGTRGVPARYGGFETAVEEIGRRLVARGHQVTVYCRSSDTDRPSDHLGMRLVHLPAARRKTLETLSHTALSAAHVVAKGGHDVAIVFNAANAPFVPALHLRRLPVAVHVDGLEWRRAKWSGAGKRFYRIAEGLAVRWADALIADAQGIADYYIDEFGASTDLIAYGASILDEPGSDRLAALNAEPGEYHLVVARFEPENHVDLAIEGYVRSAASAPLIVVGSAPYAGDYTRRIVQLASADRRVRLVGGVWDQAQLDQLYAHARTYIHGHSVGGTNPSLLRAMGAGAPVLAYDVSFNREVTGTDDAAFWSDPTALARLIEQAEADLELTKMLGRRLRVSAQERYNWEGVTDAYEKMCSRLAGSHISRRGRPRTSLLRIARR
jgi:glycosyltransferase involved in cell wall biosynthesis